ncbi:FUSC family protein [Luteimonas sp. S4-F44]|uniref:FUSC family protein n=1 Tax=Luteimonas sp. S4-F44 TaxID=2925842 RepID=UPI001F539053|nr:FUSC family protein [Luteimonas sp. S4-F44]UNK41041.1 FUSC family protein [Luteimonas sp. S4-F44]
MHATPNAETSPGVPPTRLVRLRDALASGLLALDLTTPRATYVMRSLLAAGLALVVAYWLDLHAPYAAASSVLLVIHPVQGAVIGKGAWRVMGTLAGMLAAFVLMGAFGQMPWLFLLGFGLWLGLCVVGMTLLRHFRAYGATLAGYTVGLAAYGAMQHPELTFDQVIGRGASVLVGVVCLAAVSVVFSARSVHSRLAAQLHRLAAATADVLATQHQAIHGRDVPGGRPLDPGRRALILEVYGVDDLLALGKAESADLARRAGAVRQAMVSLFSALIGGAPPMGGHGAALDALRAVQPDWEQTWRQASDALGQAPGAPGLGRAAWLLSGLRTRVRDALATVSLEPAEQATLTIAGDRLIEQLDDYLDALASIAHVHSAQPIAGGVSVPFHRDTGAAIENGLRAMLTVVLGGAFWIVTGWTYGHMMLAGLAAACALLSTAPDPARGAVAFLQGTVAAAAMAFVCAFVVLPQVSGLPLLLVVLGLFWWPGIYATTMPRHALAGVAYLVAFTSLAAVDNPMRQDIALFLNGAVAWILAVCFTLLGFRTVLPRNASRDVGRLRQRIQGDALATLSSARADTKAWQWRQQHRIAQLGALLRAQPEAMDRAVADALASLHLGREVLRLRQWLRRTPDTTDAHRVVSVALARMRRRAGVPILAARHARRAAVSLSRTIATSAAAMVETRRLIGALLDIAALLERHAGAVPQRKRAPDDVA